MEVVLVEKNEKESEFATGQFVCQLNCPRRYYLQTPWSYCLSESLDFGLLPPLYGYFFDTAKNMGYTHSRWRGFNVGYCCTSELAFQFGIIVTVWFVIAVLDLHLLPFGLATTLLSSGVMPYWLLLCVCCVQPRRSLEKVFVSLQLTCVHITSFWPHSPFQTRTTCLWNTVVLLMWVPIIRDNLFVCWLKERKRRNFKNLSGGI